MQVRKIVVMSTMATAETSGTITTMNIAKKYGKNHPAAVVVHLTAEAVTQDIKSISIFFSI
ncbi:hypothetical protein NARC_40127 [Candidatus Nitrosocosmicus arcticus]|uniref:Uncharacterized protein n=1 Tax=Candidatus Nitrosocosmicus arcticus TaxID=2035267 RepID=A0A557SX38_9ARCH|nr:hypothetical protein NARC_40127 [Candidatus Nitrosocosmicus arcticus]